MQVEGDLDGLEQALGRKTPSKMFGSGSCSALLKLLPGNKDLLISHDTWGPYNTMLRLFKFYNLPFHLQPGAGVNCNNTYPVERRVSDHPKCQGGGLRELTPYWVKICLINTW